MAHVIHSINLTTSGSCHHLDSVVDETHLEYATDLTRAAEAMVLGRNTFELFAEFWPDAIHRKDLSAKTLALAKSFHTIPKLVVSSSPIETDWPKTTGVIALEDLARTLHDISGTVVVFGSPGLSSSLLNAGLVDELHMIVQPLIGMQGPHAFSGLDRTLKLTRMSLDSFESGAVLLRYSVNN